MVVKEEREKDKKITPVVNQVSGKDESHYKLENGMLRNQCEELARKMKEQDKEMERMKARVENFLEKEKKNRKIK